MHGGLLRDLVVALAVAIPTIVLARRVRLPSVVGFLLAGVAIGPSGLGLVGRSESVEALAEVGVLLLLFTIGLEMSLSQVRRLGRTLLQGGAVQLVGTAAAFAGIAVAAGMELRAAIFTGMLLALSSTAIVLKLLGQRRELDSAPGRTTMAVLLFQDLCVVPLALLVPVLAGTGEGAAALAGRLGLSLAVVTAIVVVGRLVVPRVLEHVVGVTNREIFTLCIAFFGLAAAFATASFGLSLALGAFLAGLVISESKYGLQALSDALPFRDAFGGIFFISIGMLLDLGLVAERPLALVALTAGVVVVKAAVAAGAVLMLGRSARTALVSGLGLAQVGEFSFVLAGSGVASGLMDPAGYQLFLGVSVLSMLAAPFLIAAAPRIADALLPGRAQPREAGGAGPGLEDHVIVVGRGVNGRNLARVLRAAGIPHVILDEDGQVVRRARAEGEPVVFGDGTRPEVLEHVGVRRARVLVFAISSQGEERRGVAVARHLAPGLRIVVRTRYVASIEELLALGADEVVAEEFETSIEIFARVLRTYGVARNVIEREISAVRAEGYEVLRGVEVPPLPQSVLTALPIGVSIETVQVEPGARACGRSLPELELRKRTGATVIAVVREGRQVAHHEEGFAFREEDTVALLGEREALDAARRVLVAPS